MRPIRRLICAQFRPQATAPFAGYRPIPHYPDVPMHAIVTADDNIVLKALHTPMIRRRMGVESYGFLCSLISLSALRTASRST